MQDNIRSTTKDMVDIGSLAKRSWALFTEKPLEHIVAALIVMVLGTVTLGILLGPLAVGHIRMVDKQTRGEAPRIEDVFSGFSSFGAALLAGIIFAVAVTVGMLLLVVPGLFVIAAWSYAFWFIALKGSSATDSLGEAWNLLKTQAGSVIVVLVLLAVVNAVAGSIVFATLLSAPLSVIFCTLAFQDMTSSSASPVPIS
jgi:uncharacterized membrane protein